MLFVPLLLQAVDHLLISEVVLQPNDGEYVLITNPTGSSINLENYYISDGVDQGGGKFYYNLPTLVDFWSGSSSDFIARFPDTSLSADASILLCLTTASRYETTYGTLPDLVLQDDMRNAISDVTTIGSAPRMLDNVAESLVLFYWDGISANVQDVEYLLWGTDSSSASQYTIDKTGVNTYLDDTPGPDQSYMPTHFDGSKLIRNSEEGIENNNGGNGITGHDETSENLSDTWSIVDLTIYKPEISDPNVSPSDPETTEDMLVTVDVVDSTGITSVSLTYTFPSDTGTPTVLAMSNTGGDTWSVTIPATGEEGELAYFITAINTSGLSGLSQIGGVTIADPPPPLSIQTIRENLSSYLGQTVSMNAVVSIGSGIIRTDRTSMYIQDNSGYGININESGMLNPALLQGDSLLITGTVGDYTSSSTGDYTVQLSSISYTLIAQDRPIPAIREISSADLNDPTNEGSFVKIWGAVQSRSDGIGGGSNIVVEDAYGSLTLRIWDTTNLLSDLTADSLLTNGNLVDVYGVASTYQQEGQLLVGYAGDVQAHKEGVDSEGETSLEIAPYPFVPQLAETIEYTYKFPANSRITLRVFDLSGHLITTLFEDYRSLSLEITKTWDGRNEISQITPAGTYIMHLETVNRSNGEIISKMAPVVIGSR